MKKIEHIGIAVKDLEASTELFAKLLGEPHYKIEEVESEKVKTSFFRCGETKIELLGTDNEHSAIYKFVEKRGQGIHHIAFLVDDIYVEIERLISEGFQPVSKEPFPGADNKLVFFFHPKSTNGVLIELCQELETK